jgi:predicted permease
MNWWQRLWRRKKMEEQLERELQFHLEKHVAELIAAGSDPAEARRCALLAIGGSEQFKEECRDARGTRWLEDLWQDLRYALRTLRKRPGFAAVAILTLAVGIGATTIMFTVINGVLLKPLAFPESEKLVTLREHTQNFGDPWGFSYPSFLDAKRESRTVALAAWTYGGGTISNPGEAEYADGIQISEELLPVLGVTPILGRNFAHDEDRVGGGPVAIISYGLWQRRFEGNPGVVGRSIVLDKKNYTIVGVTPANFRLETAIPDVIIPLGQSTEPRMQNRAPHFIHLLGRIRPGATLEETRAELALFARHRADAFPQTDADRSIVAIPMRQDVVKDVRSTLWILLGAVSLVMLIVCANVASLLLARAVSRERELAMRVALGASRGRLVRQCLTESAVLGLFGGLLGILLATFGVEPFVRFWPGDLPRANEIHLDWRVLCFGIGASLFSGVLFGLAPALRAPSRELEQTLRSGGRALVGSTRRLHSVFVISEIALAIVLLVTAGMLGRTLLDLSSLDPGLDIRNVMVARLARAAGADEKPAQIRATWLDILERARRTPGVRSVALTDIIPMRNGENVLSYWATPAEPPANQEPIALASGVTPDYLKVMGIPLRGGRFIDEHDRAGSELVVVIDDKLAQHAFGSEDPVGKRLWIPAISSDPVHIVGVTGHVRHWGLGADDQSIVRDQIYYPLAQVPGPLLHFFSTVMSIAVRTEGPPLNLAEPLSRELGGSGADEALYEIRTMEQLAGASLARQRFLLLLFSVFAGIALALACIGIYGVLSYLTGQRVPEMGVRVALGASSGSVMWLVLRESLVMLAVGVALGTGGALASGRVLTRLVEGMRPMTVSTFAIVIPLLVSAALIASFLPAYRAGRVDPVTALRQD